MTMPKFQPVFTKILGVLLLSAVATSCNDSETTKESVSDTTTIVTPPPSTPDTMKMDTASTRPVKNPD
jgi:hypothetical protein